MPFLSTISAIYLALGSIFKQVESISIPESYDGYYSMSQVIW